MAARRISFGSLRQARPCAEDCFNDEDIVYRCVALAAAVSRSFVGGSTSPSTNSLPRVEHRGATSTNEPMNVLIIMGKILRALPHLRREYPHSTLGGDLFYFGGSTTKLIFNPSPRSRSKLRFERGARLTDDCSVVTHCRCLLLDLVMLGADLGVPRLVANRCVPRLVLRMPRTSIDNISLVPPAATVSQTMKESGPASHAANNYTTLQASLFLGLSGQAKTPLSMQRLFAMCRIERLLRNLSDRQEMMSRSASTLSR